jgi:hypothetical protein
MMAELGILPHITATILNHVSGHKSGVAGVCNRARYLTEMREAFVKWADYIDAITSSPPVGLKAISARAIPTIEDAEAPRASFADRLARSRPT